MAEAAINYLAVLAAAIVSMIVGGLWYSPLLFGKAWMKLMNLDEKKLEEAKKKGMTKSYVIAFIGSLVTAYVLAHFVDYAGAVDYVGALQLSFWIWLGFFAAAMLSSILWEGKPVKLYLINIFHYLVSLCVMSLILALWI